MLGAQGKAALERGISRNPDFTGRTAEAVAAVMRENLQASTKQFAQIIVQVVPVIERPKQEAGAKIPNILKMRHITLYDKDKILARPIACFSCLEEDDRLCASCSLLPPSYPKQAAPKKAATKKAAPKQADPQHQDPELSDQEEDDDGPAGDDAHLDDEVDDLFNLLTEEDKADAEEDDMDEVAGRAGEEEVEVGEVLWAKERRGSYWPCQAIPFSMVPKDMVRRFGAVPSDSSTWVRFFGREGYCKPLPPWSLFPFLGNTVFDMAAKGTGEDRERAFVEAIMAKNNA